MRCLSRAILLFLFLFFGATLAGADDAAFFEAKIRPVLVEHCYACHSADAKELKANLRLDSHDGLRIGGDSGPVLVPGKPDESLIVEALRYEGLEMPPDGRLPEQVARDFEQWILDGAIDPRTDAASPPPQSVHPQIDIETGRKFWAFQPVQQVSTPTVADTSWPKTDIDHFVLAKLEDHAMRPPRDADRETLLRRVYFDLTGLPPTIAQRNAFLRDDSPTALARLVDQLLDSPQFGAQWGRHWLDVARYADSNGNDFNATFHNAWKYRDYVIQSFNEDKPFDQFVREQIAGDLLPYESDQQRTEQIVATGFLMVGTKMLSERDKDKLTMDVVDEQIATVGQAFLGMTLGCARCHDHKFDPIPTTDYYALAGIFLSTRTLQGESQKYVSTWPRRDLPTDPEQIVAVDKYEQAKKTNAAKLKAAQKQRDTLTKQQKLASKDENPKDENSQEAPAEPPTSASRDGDLQSQLDGVLAEIQRLEAEAEQLESTAPAPIPKAFAVDEAETIVDCALRIRGQHNNCGPVIPRGFLKVASSGPAPEFSDQESGRRELAAWISDAHNPLTARVLVNRVWHHLLGAGLVRSVDNFGQLGELPSHSELLDHLATDFIQHGWSIKHLIRRIVLSRVYQMASEHNESFLQLDPENRLLWRSHRKRLSAEAIRDALLACSERLERTPAGSPVEGLGTLVTQNSAKQNKFQQRESLHRSLYMPIIRGELPPMLVAFDFADPDMVVGKRSITNVPSQSLLLMNSPFVMTCAKQAAQSIQDLVGSQDNVQLVQATYQRLLTRDPTPAETKLALEFLADLEAIKTEQTADSISESPLTHFIHTLFAATEFRFLD